MTTAALLLAVALIHAATNQIRCSRKRVPIEFGSSGFGFKWGGASHSFTGIRCSRKRVLFNRWAAPSQPPRSLADRPIKSTAAPAAFDPGSSRTAVPPV
eukprot:CAMPEP_0182572876 /NCGR_PEP_ID=MMETSP1324-20130603/17942_1 /TAXON_ID=236786 /ORGANISM="Florenciella sp., Strain RCC1587" /LENGTH=98 /DNA_ID=CAMNT_0024787895 /DNA_START=108 /DNA_END=401 /DNA_ORIENTATION=+